jgi:beta-xylosidase
MLGVDLFFVFLTFMRQIAMAPLGAVLLGIALTLESVGAERADPPSPRWGDFVSWGDQRDGTYCNPVLPADYCDLDCIRVGTTYYAISSTMQLSPGMVVLQSADLVNWSIVGHAVSDLTQIGPEFNWDRMSRYSRGVWAGSIRYHDRKFYVLFGTPDEGFFITSARAPEGPWKPLHPLMPEAGWADCSLLWEDDGQAYFVGTDFQHNNKTYIFRMSANADAIKRDSALLVHEGHGREANKLLKINGWYYLFFSEVRAGGVRHAMARRARQMAGPWSEVKQLSDNDIAAHNPIQGGLVPGEKGAWYFFTHHGSGDWEGRAASTLPVTWIDDWPILGQVGTNGMGRMVWRGQKPVQGGPVLPPQTSDEFTAQKLAPQWEWNHQPRSGKWSLSERPGWMRLKAFKPLRHDDLMTAGNTLSQRSYRTATNEVVVKLDLSGMADGQKAGLCHFAGGHSASGVVQEGAQRRLEFRVNGELTPGPTLTHNELWLRSTWGLNGMSQYSYSTNGVTFSDVGKACPLTWGNYRGDRIGIYSFNNQSNAGQLDVDYFRYDARGVQVKHENSD